MRTPLTLSDAVAANIRRLRSARRLSVRDVSARLGELGRPLLPSGVTNVEHSDLERRRRVDVDDLAAFALVLDSDPATLLTPVPDDGLVALTPEAVAKAGIVVGWVRGQRAVHLPGEPDQAFDARERSWLDIAPEALQRDYRVGTHPLMLAISGLHALARDAVDARADVPDRAALAEGLRSYLARVSTYVQLTADQLEQDDQDDARG